MRTYAILFILIFSFFSGNAQDNGPTLEDCVAWLHENTTFRSSYKNRNSTVYSTTYEKNGADPNLAKVTYSTHSRNSGWTEEYTFRWSDITRIDVYSQMSKKPTLHKVFMKFYSKNDQQLITRKHIASGNAIVGKSVTNGFVIEKFVWFSSVMTAFPDQGSAQNATNRFQKIANRILELSKGSKSGIDDSFFNDGN